MNKTLPVFAALAFGLAAFPAAAQDGLPPPPPEGAPGEAAEALPPPAAPDVVDAAAPDAGPGASPRGRRFGAPRRPGGPGAAGRPVPGAGRPGFGGPDAGASLGFVVPLLQKPETAAKIGLDPDKAAALAATFEDLDAQIEAVNEKLPDAFRRQADALDAAEPDEAAVLAAVNEVWDLRREVAVLQTRKLLAVRTTLDAGQIAAARKLLKEAWKDFGGRGPRDGDRRPGGPGPREPRDR
ncbi:MAG: hypothetical protein IJV65_03955 [Kiritimatiellae bacterium]|nr:hypothetical protein [Kiritimatiellia bacterium]